MPTNRRETVHLGPGSEEWLDWRETVRSASEAPIIMGAAPAYWERNSWADLRNPKPQEPSDYTREIWAYGHRREEEYRRAHHPHLMAVNLQRGDYGASLDIADLDHPFDGPIWWEVKSPVKATSKIWAVAADAPTPDDIRAGLAHVWWQLVHQAYVVGGGRCYLVVTDPRGDGQIVLPIPVTALMADWPILRAEWEAFGEGLEPGIRDEAWEMAARDYLAADGLYKEAVDGRKQSRSRLLSLAQEHSDPRGGGVMVITSRREGNIDYRRMATDLYQKLDLGEEFDEMAERYRKPGFAIQTVRRTK